MSRRIVQSLSLCGAIFLCAWTSCRSRAAYVFQEAEFTAYSGALTRSAAEYLQIEQTKMIRRFAGPDDPAFAQLPPVVDLAAQLPAPGNQGRQHSCVGWALAFAVRSFQEQRELGWGLTTEHLFSPAFLYNQLNAGRDEGIDLVAAMDFLSREGTVPMRAMPYRAEDFRSQPADAAKTLAKGFRTLGYRRIDTRSPDWTKAAIASGEPVVLVIEMYDNFLRRGMQRAQNLYRERHGKSLGHHIVVAVGYDNARRAVKVLNSWGTEWGENGYGWIADDFFATIVKQAYILYDTPTPPAVVATLRHDDSATPPTPTVIAPPAAADTDSLLIVPEEAGVTRSGKWLRLGDPLDATAGSAIGDVVQLSDDALRTQRVAKIHALAGGATPIQTNRGIGFTSTRNDVHRIYQAPDFVDPTSSAETYFFEPLDQEWGGIHLTKHASLVFQYDHTDRVAFIGLESVFKAVAMGKGLKELAQQEWTHSAAGITIRSPDGAVTFVAPPHLSEVSKSVWDQAGYGYFLKDPNDPFAFLVVKVFRTMQPVTPALLAERIAAERRMYQLGEPSPESVTFAGLTWSIVTSALGANYLYAGSGTTIYQLQISGHKPLAEIPWFPTFQQSLHVGVNK